jgi:hypothetical protein
MKLFQRLLVAPAALGLMAPVAANADTAFSSTTSVSGSAVFTVGSVSDGGTADTEDELYMQYAYGLDLNTSFTGEDLFYAGIETGNASGPLANMDSAVDPATDDVLSVHSLFYSFPVGDVAVTAGPLVDQDDVVAATLSAHSEGFRLGSMPFSLDDSLTGPGVGVAYSGDNGFVASASFVSIDGTDSTKGINNDEGDDVATFTVGYNGEGFGGGLILASHDGENSATTAYDTFGGGIYYSPESIPATISVAYDTKDPDGTDEERTDLFVGIDYEVGPGSLSVAWNSTDVDGGSASDQTGFEVSYSYAVNDNVTITPGFFTVEETTANKEDDSGVVLETAFSF